MTKGPSAKKVLIHSKVKNLIEMLKFISFINMIYWKFYLSFDAKFISQLEKFFAVKMLFLWERIRDGK